MTGTLFVIVGIFMTIQGPEVRAYDNVYRTAKECQQDLGSVEKGLEDRGIRIIVVNCVAVGDPV